MLDVDLPYFGCGVPNLDLMKKGLRRQTRSTAHWGPIRSIVPNLDLMKKGLRPCANLSVLCALAVHIKSGADTQEIKGRIG